jgi:hypothetical protein
MGLLLEMPHNEKWALWNVCNSTVGQVEGFNAMSQALFIIYFPKLELLSDTSIKETSIANSVFFKYIASVILKSF